MACQKSIALCDNMLTAANKTDCKPDRLTAQGIALGNNERRSCVLLGAKALTLSAFAITLTN